MVNHLYRSRNEEWLKQAQLLAQWVSTQTLPVIAAGDYNFDWAVQGGERNHDPAYDAMTQGEAWEWVRPQSLVTTQCSGWPCTYDTVLDFVFTAGPARDWPARSEIAVVPGDFPDDTLRRPPSGDGAVCAWGRSGVGERDRGGAAGDAGRTGCG